MADEIQEILQKVNAIENRLIVLETEFKLIRKLAYTIIGGIGAIIGIPFVVG